MKYYTDGFVKGPGYDPGYPVVTCPHCNKCLWVDELVGSESMAEPPVGENSESLPFAKHIYGSQYDCLLRVKFWSNEDQEHVIRVKAWWAFNDRYRDQDNPKYELTSSQQTNLERLLAILGSNTSEEVLIKAEILREMGRFDECLELLKLPVDESHLDSRNFLEQLARSKMKTVAAHGEEAQCRNNRVVESGEDFRGCHEFFVRQENDYASTEGKENPTLYTVIHPNTIHRMIEFLSRYCTTPMRFCKDFDTVNRKEGRWPWAIIFFENEYRLAGHLLALRQHRSDYSIAAFSWRGNHSVAEMGVPSVGIIYLHRKAVLETVSLKSALFRKVWDELKDKSENQHWICIPEPPSEKWLRQTAANDDELFMKHYRKFSLGGNLPMDDLLKCAGGDFIFPSGASVALENVDGMRRAVADLFPENPDAAVKSLCDCAADVHKAGFPGLVEDYIGHALAAGGTAEVTARALLELGAALERAKDVQTAAVCYGNAMHLPERDTFTWYFLHNNLGYCLANLGRFEEAVPHCLMAIRIDPARHNAFKNLGIAFQGLCRLEEAAGCFRHAYIVKPEDGRARQHLAELLFGGRIDDVPNLWSREWAFKIARSDITDMERSGGASVGGSHVPLNDFDGMYLAFAEHFEEQTAPICIALSALVWLYALKGMPIDLGSVVDRITAVGTPAEAAGALVTLADSLGNIGKPVMALECFSRAKTLIPPGDHFLLIRYHDRHGWFHIDIDHPREAEPHFRESIRLDRWSARSHRGLGIALLAQGESAAAEREMLMADALSQRPPWRLLGEVST